MYLQEKKYFAGNGPFNIQVALELERAGVDIVGISESAFKPSLKSIKSILQMFIGSPKLFFQGMRYLKELKKKIYQFITIIIYHLLKKMGMSWSQLFHRLLRVKFQEKKISLLKVI